MAKNRTDYSKSRLENYRPGMPLSKRELEVIQIRLTGLSFKEVGNKLNLSEDTVSMHIFHARRKLQLPDSTFALIRWAANNQDILNEERNK